VRSVLDGGDSLRAREICSARGVSARAAVRVMRSAGRRKCRVSDSRNQSLDSWRALCSRAVMRDFKRDTL
jgi:hypothetical protein